MDVLEKAQRLERDGHHVVHLEIGEPDFDTPQCIKDAASRALAENRTHYTHSLGLRELREAICARYQARYGVCLDPEQILVTSGTSPAMWLLFSGLLEEGDEVIVSDPCYACYKNFITFAGARARPVPVTEEDAFQYRIKAIRERLSNKTRMVLVNSPANPTGQVMRSEQMARLVDLCTEYGLMLVSDEIYHGLVYEGREHSVLEFTDEAFVFNGFSKLYAMTGWRLGWLVAPKPYMRGLQKLAQNFFISASAPAQWAGVSALTMPEARKDVARMVATYDERRRYLLGRLKQLGFHIPTPPTGAFYVLVNCKDLAARFGGSSLDLAFDILDKVHVGVTPGVDFGPGGEGYLRLSYAADMEDLSKGMDRLGHYIEQF